MNDIGMFLKLCSWKYLLIFVEPKLWWPDNGESHLKELSKEGSKFQYLLYNYWVTN